MEGAPRTAPRNPTHTHGTNGRTALAQDGASEAGGSTAVIAHTLTACTRCRQRKTRCDPNLPKCGPCERTKSVCEYYDSNKGQVVNRNYVVYLQRKVRELEEELEKVENEDVADDPEAMMRAATVRMQDARESKFLGPSSGIAITRLVMQLAKQFTDAKSIREIVPDVRAKQIKDLYSQEQAKPTSKIYPITSNVAAPTLPERGLTDALVDLYKLKVQPMYPALHEPTLDADIKLVYEQPARATPFQHFVTRMVIAISLQKMDTQYAGLADSFYLAALMRLEPCMRPMDLQSLQCFALMAEYSLLTPTRTAIYYVVGIAVRLLQALGYNEEKTITMGRLDPRADPLEIDMRRRLFWCIWVMELGLAHSLGRPSIMATSQDHIDVDWFETCDDQHITRNGKDPAARPTLKKWVAIHFFKMRLLQLEIRRTLYLRRRPAPRDDTDPWFVQMSAKMIAWRDASPDTGESLDKRWFTVRYNTIVVFLYRPSPQIPRPTLSAAMKCFEACSENIYLQRDQILGKSVDLTWIFTQAIFMAINTMLWSLSYVEVRRAHSRASVEKHLEAAMQAITYASERWPGVASAVQLYSNLIEAILKVYEKDGDVHVSAATPSEAASPPGLYPNPDPNNGSTSPATASSNSVPTPPEHGGPAPFGYIQHRTRRSVEQPPPVPYLSNAPPPMPQPPMQAQPGAEGPQFPHHPYPQSGPSHAYNLPNQWNALPDFTPELQIPPWNPAFPAPHHPYYAPTAGPSSQPHQNHNPQAHQQNPYDAYADPVFDPNSTSYPFPQTFDNPAQNDQYMQAFWDVDGNPWTNGLDETQQQELMRTLQTEGMEDIQHAITSTLASYPPKEGGDGDGGGGNGEGYWEERR